MSSEAAGEVAAAAVVAAAALLSREKSCPEMMKKTRHCFIVHVFVGRQKHANIERE